MFPKHRRCYHLPKELGEGYILCVTMFVNGCKEKGSGAVSRVVSVVCSGHRNFE